MATTKGRNRSQKRQRAVKKLRQEGRPVGPPAMGVVHRGPRGNRYAVPDSEASEIVERIIVWRDVDGLSWEKVSDQVDLFLADKHDRPPTLRCNRPTWTAAMCRLRYLREKELRVTGDSVSQATRRRCVACGRSKPIDEFSRRRQYRRRTCMTCRALRRFVEMETEKRQALIKSLRQLARLAKQNKLDSPQAEEISGELREIFITDDTVGREWHHLLVATQNGPQFLLGQFQLLLALLRTPRQKPPVKGRKPAESDHPEERPADQPEKPAGAIDFSTLSDEELKRLVARYKRSRKSSTRKGKD